MSTSWRPFKDNSNAHGYATQQVTSAPYPPTFIYPNVIPKTYMYSYASATTPPTLEVPRRDPFPFKATMNPTQYLAAPDDDDDDDEVPLIGPVPRLAKKAAHQTPPRTKGGCTPHPAASPTSFREQMRTPLSVSGQRMKGYSQYSPSSTIPESPETPMQFEALPTPMPWAGAGNFVDGQNYFKMYDAVHVAVLSTRHNKYIWVQGVVMKPTLHVNQQGQEERLYNVTFVHPDTKQDDFQDFSPSSGRIRAAPRNEALPGQLAIWAPVTETPSSSRASQPDPKGMRVEKGTFVFSQMMVKCGKTGENKKIWIPGVCVGLGKPMPGQPAGYWIRAVGGPTIGGEYYAEGPFKTYGTRTLRELQATGECVDVRGCENFAET